MFSVFLGLGSNVGDRFVFLTNAIDELKKVVTVLHCSSVYETEPWRMNTTQSFYNISVEIETLLQPQELLPKLKDIEKKLGRTTNTHMKPREIDIDILLYEGYTHQDEHVIVPHPELHLRRFALEPLCEIDSTLMHPVFNTSIEKLLKECPDSSRAIRIKSISTELPATLERT